MSYRAKDAVTRDYIVVSADSRATDYIEKVTGQRGACCAVFEGEEFLGLLSPLDLLRYPQRIFADLVHLKPASRIPEDAPLETFLQALKDAQADTLPVFNAHNQFVGVVSHSSITELLSKKEREKLAAFSKLVETWIDLSADLALPRILQKIVDLVCGVTGARYGALSLVDEGGAVIGLAVTGIEPSVQAAIGRLPTGEGVLGVILREKKTLRLRDLTEDPRHAGFPSHHPPMRSFLGTPLLSQGKVVGILYVAEKERREEFTEDDEALIMAFAAQAALAAENDRLFANLQAREAQLVEQTRRAEALYEATRTLTADLSLGVVLRRLVENAQALAGARYAALGVVDEQGRMAQFIPVGLSAEQIQHIGNFPQGRGLLGLILQEGRTLRLDDLTAHPSFSGFPPHHPPMRSFLGVPLLARGRIIGALYLTEKERGEAFTPADERLLLAFAADAAVAIENARLYERVGQHAGELEERVRERTREISALYAVSAEVTRSLALEQILERAVQTVAEATGVETVALRLVEGDRLVLKAHSPPTPPLLWDAHLSLGKDSLLGRVVESGQPLMVSGDAPGEMLPPADLKKLGAAGYQAFAAVPLKAADRVVGVLGAATRQQGLLSPRMLALFMTLADQIAIAVQNAQLYSEVQRQNEALEKASQFKSRFLANMSHELRTPLNSILGFAEVLIDQTFGLLSEKQIRHAQNIHDSGKHLLNIISDILDLSKVEAGQLRLEPTSFSLPTALEGILAMMHPQAAAKKVHIELDVDCRLSPLIADPLRFKQIMSNLLSNAIKFTPEGGRVAVGARYISLPSSVALGSAEECVEISVTDTGIGIKSEDLPKLFQEFVQLDQSLARKYQGTGLGLALTKRLVELHGGRIEATSEGEGRGSTFAVTLPLSGPPPQ